MSKSIKSRVKVTVASQAGYGVQTIADNIAAQLKTFGLNVNHQSGREPITAVATVTRLALLGHDNCQVEIVEEQTPRVVEIASVRVFEKSYSGEELSDVERDISEAFEDNPAMEVVPVDEYNLHKGTFKVSITWEPEAEDEGELETPADCSCVYATPENDESVRLGISLGGYLKKQCAPCKKVFG